MPSPKATRAAESRREKAAKALELRKAGFTYDQIATQVGYASRSGAYKAVNSALQEITREPAEVLRSLELERLDALTLAVWRKARQGNVQAIDRVVKLMERRSKLTGLDAPEAHKVEGNLAELLALGLAEGGDTSSSEVGDIS